jgi:hypothetical protein
MKQYDHMIRIRKNAAHVDKGFKNFQDKDRIYFFALHNNLLKRQTGKGSRIRRKWQKQECRTLAKLIWDAQEGASLFYFTSKGKWVGEWNRPWHRKLNYLVLEIGHDKSKDAGGKDCLSNFVLLSGRANEHLQTSLSLSFLLRNSDFLPNGLTKKVFERRLGKVRAVRRSKEFKRIIKNINLGLTVQPPRGKKI